MNILFSCAGRRNYLLRYFKEALIARGDTGKIIATDASQYASAFVDADVAIIAPRIDSDGYVDQMIRICKENEASVLISLNDLDLPILAQNREKFLDAGIEPIVSDADVIEVAFDKWKTVLFLKNAGLPFPKTYLSLNDAIKALDSNELKFPLIVKPRWGSGSIGVETVDERNELEVVYELVKTKVARSILNAPSSADYEHCVLIQEKIVGKEYGLDVINDLKGAYVATIVKEKLAMRAGETDKARVVSLEPVQTLGEKIGRCLKHKALLDVDVLEQNGKYFVLELNPRFGGGYPFSHEAGANVPAALLCWLNGETPWSRWFQAKQGSVFTKCDRLCAVYLT